MQAAYEEFGCNQGNVFFMGIDKGNDNAAVLAFDSIYGIQYPSVSGQQGGGNAVHWNYSVQSTPSIVVILPNRLIAVKNVLPPEYENVVDSISQTGGIVMECTTGVENTREISEFSIYPNPAQNEIFIESGKADQESYTLQIFDLGGKKVYATKPSTLAGNLFIEGNVETLKEGMYILKVIRNGSPVHSLKLIIKR